MVDRNTVVVNAKIDGRENERETRNQIDIELTLRKEGKRETEREYDKQLFLSFPLLLRLVSLLFSLLARIA